MGKLERRFLGRLEGLVDTLPTDWLLWCGLAVVPDGNKGETCCQPTCTRVIVLKNI